MRDRAAYRCLRGIPVAKDLLVMTRAELEREATVATSLARLVVDRGKVLYDRRQAGTDQELGSARRLLEGDRPYLDTAVYHCQQAAENALKALLTYHDIHFEKTHDLTALLQLAAASEPALAEWQETAELLSPYAVRFRYPAPVMEPSLEEAQEALQRTSNFVCFLFCLVGHSLPEAPPAPVGGES